MRKALIFPFFIFFRPIIFHAISIRCRGSSGHYPGPVQLRWWRSCGIQGYRRYMMALGGFVPPCRTMVSLPPLSVAGSHLREPQCPIAVTINNGLNEIANGIKLTSGDCCINFRDILTRTLLLTYLIVQIRNKKIKFFQYRQRIHIIHIM